MAALPVFYTKASCDENENLVDGKDSARTPE